MTRRNAFTLIEMVVAIAIMVVVMAMSGMIFRVAIKAYRMAIANAEIMRTYRAITDQLDMDIRGLTKEGEIMAVWKSAPDGSRRFDRFMFHAAGDFYSYNQVPSIRGNTARISYMIARNGKDSVLARTQHILRPGKEAVVWDSNDLKNEDLFAWHNHGEVDNTTLKSWIDIPLAKKVELLSVIADVNINDSKIPHEYRGSQVDKYDPNTIHMLLAERVDQFSVQGWLIDGQRWYPMADPNEDGNDESHLDDSDFNIRVVDGKKEIDNQKLIGVFYPLGTPYSSGSSDSGKSDLVLVPADTFNKVAGLGRALKFTFTVHDSYGLITNGRTFTHIIFLDQ